MEPHTSSEPKLHSFSPKYYNDELDRCEQVNEIKARILELEQHQAATRERKERFLQSRE
jgi:hypothetical protein